MNDLQKYRLKINKDTYYKLFPPINYFSQSNCAGDCYLLSAISSMWDSPFYKAYILNCFQETKGRLVVQLPSKRTAIITDLNGNLPEYKKPALVQVLFFLR